MEITSKVFMIEDKSESSQVFRHCGQEVAIERKSGELKEDNLELTPLDRSDCWCMVPPAVPTDTALPINVRIFDITHVVPKRIIACRGSEVLSEKEISEEDIEASTVKLDLPALSEGTVTFILLSEKGVIYSVPMCVLPTIVSEDVQNFFHKMISIARLNGSDEQAVVLLVWKESFSCFLSEVDILFDWLSHQRGPVKLIVEVFVNMLHQCCFYEAWEFAAYMLNKAAACGVTILSEQDQSSPFTAQSLRAEVIRSDEALDENRESADNADSDEQQFTAALH